MRRCVDVTKNIQGDTPKRRGEGGPKSATARGDRGNRFSCDCGFISGSCRLGTFWRSPEGILSCESEIGRGDQMRSRTRATCVADHSPSPRAAGMPRSLRPDTMAFDWPASCGAVVRVGVRTRGTTSAPAREIYGTSPQARCERRKCMEMPILCGFLAFRIAAIVAGCKFIFGNLRRC